MDSTKPVANCVCIYFYSVLSLGDTASNVPSASGENQAVSQEGMLQHSKAVERANILLLR